jgi:hypothetical protein
MVGPRWIEPLTNSRVSGDLFEELRQDEVITSHFAILRRRPFQAHQPISLL